MAVDWIAVVGAAAAFGLAGNVISGLYFGLLFGKKVRAWSAANPDAKPPERPKSTQYGMAFAWMFVAGLAFALAYDAVGVELPPANVWLRGMELGSFFFLGQAVPALLAPYFVRTWPFWTKHDLVSWGLTWVLGGLLSAWAWESARWFGGWDD